MALKGGKVKGPGDPGRFVGPGVFFFCFAVYLSTLAPTVTFWDSGELILGAVSLGNPHPPGYPIFCMIGKLFSLLPLGNAAYRVNLLSAVFGAGAAYLIFLLLKRMAEGKPGSAWPAAAGGLIFAFSPNFWGVAVVTEVYALNAFLLSGTLHFLYMYDRERRVSYLYASALAVGLALVNHQSVLMFVPAYLAFCLLSDKNYRKPKVISLGLFFFALGYSTVLYLPVRAAVSPAINIGDPRYLSDFLWLIKWPDNVGLMKDAYSKLVGLLKEAPAWAPVLAVLFCAAVVYLLRRNGFTLLLIFSALAYYAGFTIMTRGYQELKTLGLQSKFYAPVILFSVAAAGWLLFKAWGKKPGVRRPGPAWTAVLAAFFLAFPAGMLVHNYKGSDHSRDFFANDFATNTLKSVKQGGALFAWGDNGVFPVWYLQVFERFRDDVFFVHTELLTYPWYMADRQTALHEKYGIMYSPPSSLGDLSNNVSVMRFMIERRAPAYFDYSATRHQDIKFEKLKPQGLVHLVPTWKAMPLGRIWDSYVLRGAFDGSADKAFAAEGILEIYAWESAVWAQDAYQRGRLDEALKAYELSRDLGLRNEYLDRWAEDVRKSLRAGMR